jgi:hypothetical protein
MVEAENAEGGSEMKIVINKCYGGYGLSKEAYKALGLAWDGFGYAYADDRTNLKLVEVVEKLGEAANGGYAQLKVAEVPDDIEWAIDNYDGVETVHEAHRTWE